MTDVRAKRARADKRNLFAELKEGMTALAESRQGKRTQRTYAIAFAGIYSCLMTSCRM
jgi:hypothetical protein